MDRFTHMMGRKSSFALCFALSTHCCSAVATCLLVVKLQILQALRQGQFLLDGHTQQRVQGFLFILCRSQLPLHVVQLCHVLVTPETEREGNSQTLQDNIHSSRGRSFACKRSCCSTFLLPDCVFQMGGCLCLARTTITSDISQHALRLFRDKMHSVQTLIFRLFMLSEVHVPVQQMSWWEQTSDYK